MPGRLDLTRRVARLVVPRGHDDSPAGPTRAHSARRAWLVATAIGCGAALLVAQFSLFLAAAQRAAPGDSDGATVILEGRAIAAGHVLLHGWALSLDSFWTIDALFYAGATAIDGVRPALLSVVPALIATLVVLVAVLLARDGLSGRAALVATVVVVALIGLPSRAFATYFLHGPYHVATALYCLLAFAGLRRGRFGWGFVLAVVALALGLLGDSQTIVLGVLPVLAGGIAASRRTRRWQAGAPNVLAAIGGVVVATLLRVIVAALGAFSLTKANPFASGHQIIRNVGAFFTDVPALLGLTTGPFGPSSVPLGLRVVHFVGILVLVVAVVAAARRLVLGATDPARRDDESGWRLDELLLFGLCGDLAAFVLLPIIDSPAYARYLSAGVVFASVLAARTIGRSAAALRARPARMLTALGAAVAALYLASFVLSLGAPVAPSPVGQLSAFLSSRHLTNGVGDYWSSSIVTVESRGTVDVRPVVATAAHRLVRYEKQSSASWYRGQRFDFVVYNAGAIWNGVDRRSTVATFGRPTRTYVVNTYRVLVYAHAISVSPIGSQGP